MFGRHPEPRSSAGLAMLGDAGLGGAPLDCEPIREAERLTYVLHVLFERRRACALGKGRRCRVFPRRWRVGCRCGWRLVAQTPATVEPSDWLFSDQQQPDTLVRR